MSLADQDISRLITLLKSVDSDSEILLNDNNSVINDIIDIEIY